jgi:apolipoprotein N-acyltransferase
MSFAEHVPLSDRWPWLSPLAIEFGARDMNLGVGTEATTFSFRTRQGETVTVAAPICYEQLYPATMAAFVRRGAEMLALLTNEGWFSQSHGLYQLAAFTQLQAMEVRRTIARCTNTGLTCFIDALGRLSEPAPWWGATTLTGNVWLSKELSVYTRYTDYFPKVCGWLVLGLALAVITQFVWQFVWSTALRRAVRVSENPAEAGTLSRVL